MAARNSLWRTKPLCLSVHTSEACAVLLFLPWSFLIPGVPSIKVWVLLQICRMSNGCMCTKYGLLLMRACLDVPSRVIIYCFNLTKSVVRTERSAIREPKAFDIHTNETFKSDLVFVFEPCIWGVQNNIFCICNYLESQHFMPRLIHCCYCDCNSYRYIQLPSNSVLPGA